MFLFAEADQMNLLQVILDFKSNILNYLLLLGLIGWLCAKYLPPVLASRKESIELALKNAAAAKEESQRFFEEQKIKVANAQTEADQILTEAKQAAEQMRIEMDKQTEVDIANLLKKFEMALANERQSAIAEMRAVAIRAAIKLTEESLRSAMTDEARAKLLTQFVEQLDNISDSEQLLPTGQFERIR